MTVTALAGTPLHDAQRRAARRSGWRCTTWATSTEQTLAGAISTGTHGTGGVAAVAGRPGRRPRAGHRHRRRCCAPTAGRERRRPRRGPGRPRRARHPHHASPSGSSRSSCSRRASSRCRWDEALGGFDELADGSRPRRHVLVPAHRPDADQAQQPPRHRPRRGASRSPARRAWLDDELPPEHRLRRRSPRSPTGRPRADPADQPARARGCSAPAPTPTSPHRVFTAAATGGLPGDGVRRARARPASTRCARPRALDASDLRISFPVEIRVRPRRRHPAVHRHGRDSFYLAFHTHRDAEHRDYFALIEPILRAHDGRPHWGKVHTRTAADLAPAYPRFGEFLALRDRLDPERVFANDYLRRVLGD